MPSNAGNVGSDFTFGYFDANLRQLIDLGDVQDVKITWSKHDLKNMPYNGNPKFGFKSDGFKITFKIIRNNSSLEDILKAREANFDSGGFSRAGYLNETIKNGDGTVSRNQYTGFVFWMTDMADISRDKLVTQSCEGFASTCVTL